MSITSSTFSRDANYVPITTLGLITSKTMVFDGATVNDPGDFNGTGNPATLFVVTGTVSVNVVGFCTTDLAGAAATIELGVASSTAALGDQQTATDVNQHMSFHDAVLAIGGNVDGHSHVVDENVIQTVGTANITSGALVYYCWWVPLSTDGNVVAA